MPEAPIVPLIRELTFGASPWKLAVRALAASNVTRSGPQTIDGVALVRDQLVLLVGQSNATENGPWVVKDGAWTRPSWFDEDGKVITGSTLYVSEGSTYQKQFWTLTTTPSNGRIRLGFDNLTWDRRILGGGAPLDQAYWIAGAPDVSLTNAIDTTSVTTTLEVATTTSGIIPLAARRTSAATAEAVDVGRDTAMSGGTALVGFGTSRLLQAANGAGTQVDIARMGAVWTNPAAAAEASKWIFQTRSAGGALATVAELSSTGLELLGGSVTHCAAVTNADGAIAVTAAGGALSMSGSTTASLVANSGTLTLDATSVVQVGGTYATRVDLGRSGQKVRLPDLAGGGTRPLTVDNNGDIAAGSGTTAPLTLTVDDATANGVTTILTLRHTTTDAGHGAANIGARLAFEAEDAGGNTKAAAYLTGVLTTATNGGETSKIGFWTRTAGGALAETMTLSGAGALAVSDATTITKSGIGNTPTRGLTVVNDTNSGTQWGAQIGWSAINGGTQINAALQFEPQSTSRSILRLVSGTGTGAPSSSGPYWDTSDSNFGNGWFANAFVCTGIITGFRFNDSNNRGGFDLNGSSWLRAKSYNTKGFAVETGADSGGSGGVERLIIDGSGKGRAVFVPHVVTSSGGAVTFPLATSQNIRHTTTEDTTVTITGATPGMHGCIDVLQGALGKRVTLPINGVGIEYTSEILALNGGTNPEQYAIDQTANTRTVLTYYVTDTPFTRLVITSRFVHVLP